MATTKELKTRVGEAEKRKNGFLYHGRQMISKKGEYYRDWWNRVLTANEKASKAKKLTDDQIADAFEKDFGKPPTQTVRAYRTFYNNGLYGFGEEDVKKEDDERSREYDADGKAVPRKIFGKEVSAKTESKPKAKKRGKGKGKKARRRRQIATVEE